MQSPQLNDARQAVHRAARRLSEIRNAGLDFVPYNDEYNFPEEAYLDPSLVREDVVRQQIRLAIDPQESDPRALEFAADQARNLIRRVHDMPPEQFRDAMMSECSHFGSILTGTVPQTMIDEVVPRWLSGEEGRRYAQSSPDESHAARSRILNRIYERAGIGGSEVGGADQSAEDRSREALLREIREQFPEEIRRHPQFERSLSNAWLEYQRNSGQARFGPGLASADYPAAAFMTSVVRELRTSGTDAEIWRDQPSGEAIRVWERVRDVFRRSREMGERR
jgi:hypothetical protein